MTWDFSSIQAKGVQTIDKKMISGFLETGVKLWLGFSAKKADWKKPKIPYVNE